MSLLVLGGCQSDTKEKQMETDSNREKAAISEEKLKPLTICVDAVNKNAMQQLVDTWKELNDGKDAELIVIPSDLADAEAKITELRTEIMSGKGPDVFLVQGQNPVWVEQKPVLFSDPEKMMHRKIFLPLDSYLEHAQYLHTDSVQQAVWEAGRIGEEQFLLPIRYNYYAYAFRTADLSPDMEIPKSWEELFASQDELVIRTVASKLQFQYYDIFGKIADYETNTLLFSEEELLTRTEEATAYFSKGWEIEGSAEEVAGEFISTMAMSLKADKEKEHTIFGLPNMEGGITANIAVFAGINQNTDQPENAFSILDLLFRDEIVSGNGFQMGDIYLGSGISFADGISVLEEELTGLSTSDLQGMKEMNGRINTVRFYSEFDAELQELFSQYSRTKDEAERERLVSKAYQAMLMELSE